MKRRNLVVLSTLIGIIATAAVATLYLYGRVAVKEVLLADADGGLKSSAGLVGAQDMLRRLNIEPGNLKSLSVSEIAKRVTYITANFCKNVPPHVTDVDRLFYECRTACGGYVYVFRRLMDSLGIKTRYVNIYNLPSQGNHSLIEVQLENKEWSLFDPTFGAFFTVDGRPGSQVISLDELQFRLKGRDLRKNVVSTVRGDPAAAMKQFDLLFKSGEFEHKYMSLDYYHRAEAYGAVGPDRRVTLRLPAHLVDGKFEFGSRANIKAKAEQEFLKITNATLNDRINGNEVSYLFSYLGNNGRSEFRNLLRISGLTAGKRYKLTVSGYNENTRFKLFSSVLDGNLVLSDTDPITIGAKKYSVDINFRADSSSGLLMLERFGKGKKKIRVFHVGIEAVGGNMQQAMQPDTGPPN